MVRFAVRGALAAMAMSVLRSVTTRLGLVQQTPPEQLERRVPGRYPGLAVELAHWAFGAVAGALFSLLPGWARGRAVSGPVYGLAIWALFEAAAAPLLDLPERRRPAHERLLIAADHVLYGLVLQRRR